MHLLLSNLGLTRAVVKFQHISVLCGFVLPSGGWSNSEDAQWLGTLGFPEYSSGFLEEDQQVGYLRKAWISESKGSLLAEFLLLLGGSSFF